MGSLAAIALLTIFLFVRRPHTTPAAPSQGATSNSPAPAQTPPTPGLAALKLSSDAGAGKVTLDDQPPVEFQDGQWTLDKISAGEHKLKIDSAQGAASFAFSTAAGTPPTVKGPIVSHGVLAVVVGSLPDRLRIYSSDPSTRVSLDGQPPLDVPTDGLDLPSISAGPHELAMTRGSEKSPDQYKLDVNTSAAPTLNAFLESGRDLGALVVVTGQDKAKVFLNGKLQQQLAEGGQLRIPNLELKEYVVRVSKNGFQDSPEQKIKLRKGETGKLTFNLQPVPHLATLNIQGGVSGTTVLIDQASVGTVRPDGTFAVATVNPGDHVIELRKDRFKPRQIKRSFVAGAAISLGGADVALEAAPGEIENHFPTPPMRK